MIKEKHQPLEGLTSEILTLGLKPEIWCKKFTQERQVQISARKIREVARDAALCFECGKDILILPSQIDTILSIITKQAEGSGK